MAKDLTSIHGDVAASHSHGSVSFHGHPPTLSIARVENPSASDVARYIRAGRPVILSGLTKDWLATHAWDLAYLREHVGQVAARVAMAPRARAAWKPNTGLAQKSMTVSDFVDADSLGEQHLYLQEDMQVFPRLQQDYALPTFISQLPIKRTKFWVSRSGVVTKLHYDPVETFHWMVRGEKSWVCFPPGLRGFYPHAWHSLAPFMSQVELDAPDLARFPEFNRRTPVRFTLGAGDILYLPAFWWHQVSSQDGLNISINFVWFAELPRTVRHLPQFARCTRHLLGRLADTKRLGHATRS